MKIIFLFTVLAPLTLFSQIPSKEKVYESINESKRNKNLDTALCDKYYTAALKDIDRGNLNYITLYYLKDYGYYEDTLAEYYFKKTEWLWLEENTPFTQHKIWYAEDSLSFSDVVPHESNCYGMVAFAFQDSLYGPSFSAKVIHKADSLRNLGLGYHSVQLKETNLEKSLKKHSNYKLDFENFNETIDNSKNAIKADIKINDKGKIETVTCWYTHRMQGPFRRSIDSTNEYVIEVNRILKKIKGFKPAKFNGKNIEDTISIYFPFKEK